MRRGNRDVVLVPEHRRGDDADGGNEVEEDDGANG